MKKFDCVVEPFINFTAQSDFASLSPAIRFKISRQNFTLLALSLPRGSPLTSKIV